MIVFEPDRPVRGEGESPPTATAPPQRVSLAESRSVSPAARSSYLVQNNGRTALHVEQDVVPGVADLAGEAGRKNRSWN